MDNQHIVFEAQIQHWAASQSVRTAIAVIADFNSSATECLFTTLKSPDALTALKVAKEMNVRFVVLAGYLMSPGKGAFAVLIQDDLSAALQAVSTANARMSEVSSATTWLALTEDAKVVCSVRELLGGSKLNNQIEGCAKRMAERDPTAAADFRDGMYEAAALASKSLAIRKHCWEAYRSTLGIRKNESLKQKKTLKAPSVRKPSKAMKGHRK